MFAFLKIEFQNSAHLKKGVVFDLLFIFFSYQGKVTKIPLAHRYLTHIHACILLTLLSFFALPIIENNTNLSSIVSLWYEIWC